MTNEEGCGSVIEAELIGIIAQLRHAYSLLVNGYVAERNHKMFAEGLIAPQIRRLEKLAEDY